MVGETTDAWGKSAGGSWCSTMKIPCGVNNASARNISQYHRQNPIRWHLELTLTTVLRQISAVYYYQSTTSSVLRFLSACQLLHFSSFPPNNPTITEPAFSLYSPFVGQIERKPYGVNRRDLNVVCTQDLTPAQS